MKLISVHWPLNFTIIFLLLGQLAIAQTPSTRQLRNLDAFTRMYGYVRFFHPADEVVQINQARLASFGALKMLKVRNDEELIKTLQEIFYPIAPTVKVFYTKQGGDFNYKSTIPPNVNWYNQVYWQHLGINPYNDNPQFKSFRVHRQLSESPGKTIFVPLSDSLNLEPYIGRRFTFSFSAKTTANDKAGERLKITARRGFLEENKEYFANNNGHNVIDTGRQTFSFSGTIRKNRSQMIWGASMSQFFRLSIDDIKLKIEGTEPVEIKLKNEQKYHTPIKKEAVSSNLLYIQKLDELTNPELYKTAVSINKPIRKELVKGISVIIPQVLYSDDEHTYPLADKARIVELENKMYNAVPKDSNGNVIDSGDELSIRFANIIMAWNVLKHSFPNWNQVSQLPLTMLNNAFVKAISDKNSIDFFATLKAMLAPLNDGLAQVNLNDTKVTYNNAFAPVRLEKYNGKIFITKVLDSTYKELIFPGDQLLAINDVPVSNALLLAGKQISGTDQSRQLKGLQAIISGPVDREMTITIIHLQKKRTLKLTCSEIGVFNGNRFVPRNYEVSRWVAKSIYLIDLGSDSIERHLKQIDSARAVIIDLRNNNIAHHNLLSYFARSLEKISFKSYPEIDFPDCLKVRYKKFYTEVIPVEKRILKKMIFLTDASTSGDLEELALFIKAQKSGKIVGQKTAGTFKDANNINLLGDYSISFSGFKITDYNKINATSGVEPDVFVNPSDVSYESDGIISSAVKLIEQEKL